MKNIKVGAWYEKFDGNQRAAFKKLMGGQYSEVNKVRSFLTASKKKFGTSNLEYNMNSSVKHNGEIFHWMNTSKRWHKEEA